MNNIEIEKSIHEEYNDSANNSNDNCFINSNPIDNYLNNGYYNQNYNNSPNYYNMDNKSKNQKYLKNIRTKKSKICNLNDPKLLEAYNKGYYGVDNVPKQYYIYPKFSNIELNKMPKSSSKEKQTFKNNISEINNKENKINNLFNKTLSNNNFNSNNKILSSYINYPYPRLINISSNFFGQFHLSNSNANMNSNMINRNEDNTEKEKNINDLYNKIFDISLKIKDDKNTKIKGFWKITKQNDIGNKKDNTKKEYITNDNDNDDNLNDSGNFYYINNNITKRILPYNNLPDNISIDDEEEE